MHDFDKKLREGHEDENVLDRHFARWYDITPVAMELQRLGVDRIFVERKRGWRYSVEYKADRRAGDTGNAFVETVSVDTKNIPGWSFTCCAQVLIYYTPHNRSAMAINVIELKRALPGYYCEFKEVPVQNDGYKTHGLLVPLTALAKISRRVHNISGPDNEVTNVH